jgi:MATE family multidrug resistance protein
MSLHLRLHRAYRPFAFFARIDRPDGRVLRELVKVGAPIAGSILAEGGLFVTAALMMGAMGAVVAGGHQIALNYASFMFMMPLAISSATTIHVGHTLGRGEAQHGRRAGLLGIGLCAAIMSISAVAILLFNDHIAALYTNDPAVRVQVGAAGALRGFKDTTVPMALCVFSYWVVGFAMAYGLGVRAKGGPVLVWLGLTVGLTVSAILLVARYLYVSRRASRDALLLSSR